MELPHSVEELELPVVPQLVIAVLVDRPLELALLKTAMSHLKVAQASF
jgi:hypothetical protein